MDTYTLKGTEWDPGPQLQYGKQHETGTGAAAAAAPHAKHSIHARVYNGLVYMFIANEDTPEVVVATMDHVGNFIVHDEKLTLPFNVGAMRMFKKLSMTSIIDNKTLYFFAAARMNMAQGFLYGWKLNNERTFEPFVENRNIPHITDDIAGIETDNGAYISMIFAGSHILWMYRITEGGLSARFDMRLPGVPDFMRTITDMGRGYIALLIRSPKGLQLLHVYRMLPSSLEEVKTIYLPQSDQIEYFGFEIIPYYGQTQKGVARALDRATEPEVYVPQALRELVGEFVTPIEK